MSTPLQQEFERQRSGQRMSQGLTPLQQEFEASKPKPRDPAFARAVLSDDGLQSGAVVESDPDPKVHRAIRGEERLSERIPGTAGDMAEDVENVARGLVPGAVRGLTDIVRLPEQIVKAGVRTVRQLPSVLEPSQVPGMPGGSLLNPLAGGVPEAPIAEKIVGPIDEVVNRIFEPEGTPGVVGQFAGMTAAGIPLARAMRAPRKVTPQQFDEAVDASRALEPKPRAETPLQREFAASRHGSVIEEPPRFTPEEPIRPVEPSRPLVEPVKPSPAPPTAPAAEAPLASRLGSERGAAALPLVGGLAGGGAGGIAGASLVEEDDSTLERIAKVGGGFAVGAAVGAKAGRALERPAPLPLPVGIDAAYKRASGHIDFSGQLGRRLDRQAKGSFFTRLQRFADSIANGDAPIERLGRKVEKADPTMRPTQNPGYLLSYAKSSDRAVHDAIYDGVLHAKTREIAGPSYASLFKPFKGNSAQIEQALTYAVNKRLLGRGVAGFGGDAAQMADAQALVGHFDGVPEMQAFAKQLDAYTEALGRYAVDSGLWTDAQWQAIRASDALYIPTKRLMDTTVRGGQGKGMRFANVGPGVQRFTGSARTVMNPAESLAEYTDAIIRRADRYRVGAAVIDATERLGPEGAALVTPLTGSSSMARSVGTAKIKAQLQALGIKPEAIDGLDDLFVSSIDPEHPIIWRNTPVGKQYAIVNSPDLMRALRGIGGIENETLNTFLDWTFRPLKRTFTLATTAFVPRFAGGTNPARDVVDALLKTEANIGPRNIASGVRSAIAAIPGKSKAVIQAERAGLGGVSMFAQPTKAKQVARRLAPTNRAAAMRESLRRYLIGERSVLGGIERVGAASDLFTRMGEVQAVTRKYAHKVASGQWTPADLRLVASTAGRRITLDFSKKPGNPVVKLFADIIPFMGPSLQGPVRWAQAVRKSPARAAAVTTGVSAATVFAWAMKHRSPEALETTNDRSPEERSGFLLFPMDDNADLTLRVPLGQEFGVISSGLTALLDKWYDDDPNAASLFAASLIRALPPGVGEAAEGNLSIPLPGIQQMLENKANQRDYGGAPIEGMDLERLPESERRRDDTPLTYSVLGKVLGTSPVKAENLTRGVLSQAAPLVTAVTDPIAKRILGPNAPIQTERRVRSNPLNPLSAFVANTPASRTPSEERYYEIREQSQQAGALLRAGEKRGDDWMQVRAAQAPMAGPDPKLIVSVADNELELLRNARDAWYKLAREGKLSAEDLGTELDKIKRRQQVIYRRAVRLLEDRSQTRTRIEVRQTLRDSVPGQQSDVTRRPRQPQ